MTTFRLLYTMGILMLAPVGGAYGQGGGPGAPPWHQQNLVRLHMTVAGAQAVGVYASCSQHIDAEACAFTVENVRYTMTGSTASSTKFDAMCVDIGFPDASVTDAWNCSPVTRDGASVSVDAGAGGSIMVNGGVSTGATSGVGTNGQVQLGLGVALPLRSRLEIPMAQHQVADRPGVRLGGNILVESGLGPIAAGQTVVFGHSPFDGVVTFMVTRPAAMTLNIGSISGEGAVSCWRSNGSATSCPAALEKALRSACELSAGGTCSSKSDGVEAPSTAFGQGVDAVELLALLNKQQEAMGRIDLDLKDRLPGKMDDVFALLDADEEEGEGFTAAALPRLRIFTKAKTLIQQRVLPKLDEIKEIVKENVLCPS